MTLSGKTALVTGAASGIGRAIALRYAMEGALVLCADRVVLGAEATASMACEQGHSANALALDVTDDAEVEACVSGAERNYGGIDILVNCAGIAPAQAFLSVSRASFQKVLDVNLLGLFFTLQAVARSMAARSTGGRIINIASVSGRRGDAAAVQYCASKAAVISVTQSAALALAQNEITVNAIAPGYVETGIWNEARQNAIGGPLGTTPAEVDAAIASMVPLRRLGVPEDIAGLALFLASRDGSYVTGQTFNVDGGLAFG